MLRDDLIACRGGRGIFPDMVLRVNDNDSMFPGGEFIEIKDAKQSYAITSFNSTIPSSHKNIGDYITPNGNLYAEMEKSEGKNPYRLEKREVYYLVRGRKHGKCKVCLIQGGFFETMAVSKNIQSALRESMYEAMQDSGLSNKSDAIRAIDQVFNFRWKREHLAKVRKNEKASVSVRMRVMTEVINEANVLNSTQYPEIGDDTLNMIVPGHDPEYSYEEVERDAVKKMEVAFSCESGGLPRNLTVSKLKHLRDGEFVLFQAGI